MPHSTSSFVLDCRGRRLDCRPDRPGGAHVMGILNVTPDSFYDGGRYQTVTAALRRAEAMLEEGAVLIDVGGASSRPPGPVYGAGAAPVSPAEETARVVPVLEALARSFPEALLSIDTFHPSVAAAALDAGAHLVNDITGLRYGDETARVAARHGAPLILMHSPGAPGRPAVPCTYDDVTADVCDYLSGAARRAAAAGVAQVVLDPGFGFGKTPAENLRLVNEVDALVALGHPVLVGLSRKSTIGAVLGGDGAPVPPAERLFGTLGATAVAVLRGASLVRTHDVRPTVELLRVLAATVQSSQTSPQRFDAEG